MPFKSQAQRAWMHANHPEMAKRWETHTPEGKLPARVKPKGADPTLVKALKRIHGSTR